ncbi:efflux RND transporter permease subunit [Paludibaculum fermentans]|uniref:Efflux RND transporter permease subunit n=1 Tax=Paludibaculum fermentans TaxID=1473598 RepID=A0A7S7SJR0_PALFE|nr:efflux RND transporter permease subunit [Paludibaculum fermentans]QOY86978.1 efflux RND transporter permease subunit [Paludibaculum fermentans]
MQRLAEICIKRPVFATMLILALMVVGMASYRQLGVDYFPKVEFPYVNITTTLAGASPEEVETQVTKPLEEVVNTISGIDELNSTSAEGVSIISIAFLLEKDPEVAAQEVRDKINTVLGQLPKDAKSPIVEKIATDASPVLNVVVSANRDLREITKLSDDGLKKNIESISGVGQVRFVGERKRQIQVVVDGEKLYSYNLNIEQVRAALAAQNIEIPGGRIDEGNRELSLRTMGRVERPVDFERIVVGNLNGAPIRVADIGQVVDGFEEPRSLARLNGESAVVLAVRKQSGTNSLDVIAAVKTRIEQLKKSLPPDFKITYARDQSGFIEAAFEAVQEHLVLGGVFAGIIVMLFIRNWRSTLIAAIAIPTSIISTFTLLNYMGFTLNQITMLALTLVVGIVIDDAIVVLENIFRYMEEKNMSAMEAAVHGTREIGLAVMATTLSLIIIFIPIALMPGIVGRFMSSFGYTAAFAIGISLLVSFTLTPMLCSRFLRLGKKDHDTKSGFFHKYMSMPYHEMLAWSLRHRWVIVVVSVLVVLSTGPMMSRMGVDFLPVEDQSEFEVSVRMPVGSSLEGTTQVMAQIEKDIQVLPGVRDLLTTVGADQRRQVDRGSIIVELVDTNKRKESQRVLMDMTRDKLKKYKDLIVGVQLPSLISGGADRDFMYSIQGPDLGKLEQYAKRLMTKLNSIPGMADLELTYESGKPEVRVQINRDKAADLNVNVAQVANAMRVLVGGDDQVTTYREGDDRYDVLLRVSKPFRNSQQALERLFVPSATLGNVPISNVASMELGTGPTSIDRWNRQRRVLIQGSLNKGLALSDLLNTVSEEMVKMNLPPEYRHGAVGRSKELGKAVTNFLFAFLLSIVFMYMILAANYESFVDPITILLSLPLSIPFALLSLFLAGENFSVVYTSLGILVLFGIVKKNSILQVDHIKGLRREGVPRLEAVFRGCDDRLRPILMTTAALIAGMLPLAFGSGAGAGTRRTVAIVVIGGQAMALILTLVVTPVAYTLFDDMGEFFKRRTRRKEVIQPVTAMLLILLLIGAAPLRAQQKPQDLTFPQNAEMTKILEEVSKAERVGVSGTQHPLSLQEAVQMALKNNLEIELERTTVATSVAGLKGARGAFDSVVLFAPSIQANNSPAASSLAAANGKVSEHYLTNNLSVKQKTPWQGLSFHVDFDNQRQSTNNPFVSLNPNFTSRLTAGFSMPLWRYRDLDNDRAVLKIRAKQKQQSETDFETRVIDVIARTQAAYWDLAASIEDAVVAADGVRLARDQHERNQRQISAGTLAPVELAASEAELQRRIDNYVTAIGIVTSAENELKVILTPDRNDPLWNDRLMPSERTTLETPIDDLKQAMTIALEKRTELRSLELRTQQNDVQKDLARSGTKPQVNLNANYINSGLAGTVPATSSGGFAAAFSPLFGRVNDLSAVAGLPPLPAISLGGSVPASFVGGYGQGLSNLFSGNYQSVQAGLSIEWSPRNRTAEAQYEQTAITEKRLKLTRMQLEQGISAQVRNSLQALETARQRMEAARAAEKAAAEKMDSEIRLFQTGESTNFLVLTRQNELLDTRRRLVGSFLLRNKAVARLQQVLGTTLEANKVELH